MAKISRALRSLDVDIKLIPDIDVMNDENIFKGVLDAFGVSWASVENDYRIIVSNLHSPKENIKRSDAKATIDSILGKTQHQFLSSAEQKEIRNAISTVSKWETLKKAGIAGLPAGDATKAFERMNKILRESGIFLVPVGELECFIKEVGGHGPEWANEVLETYPNLNDPVYFKIKKFIAELNL